MKREILFRGKRPNSGRWIEGYLYQQDGFSYILSERFPAPECSCEVMTDTVGQFTGLLDKNGKKIFEGDIFCYKKHARYLLEDFKAKVVFENGSFGDVEIGSSTKDFFNSFSEVDELQHDFLYHIEIIGNIYENKTL